MQRNLVERDEEGPFVAVGLERAEAVRAVLSAAGVDFTEGDPDDCGCGGPVLALFRLREPFDAALLERELSADASSRSNR